MDDLCCDGLMSQVISLELRLPQANYFSNFTTMSLRLLTDTVMMTCARIWDFSF